MPTCCGNELTAASASEEGCSSYQAPNQTRTVRDEIYHSFFGGVARKK